MSRYLPAIQYLAQYHPSPRERITRAPEVETITRLRSAFPALQSHELATLWDLIVAPSLVPEEHRTALRWAHSTVIAGLCAQLRVALDVASTIPGLECATSAAFSSELRDALELVGSLVLASSEPPHVPPVSIWRAALGTHQRVLEGTAGVHAAGLAIDATKGGGPCN